MSTFSIDVKDNSKMIVQNNKNVFIMEIPIIRDDSLYCTYFIFMKYVNFDTIYTLESSTLKDPIKEYPIKDYHDPINAILVDIIKLEKGEQI